MRTITTDAKVSVEGELQNGVCVHARVSGYVHANSFPNINRVSPTYLLIDYTNKFDKKQY